ncbi:SDR family oxidoreductase [Pseudomonas sp. S60]|nr:SDR family oxidoreductase [Pseudomonas sp. S60]
MGAGAGFGPRQRRQAMLDGGAHQFMVGRVEFDQVDTVAIAVMAAEFGFVRVGQETCLHQWPTRQRAVGIDPRLGPARPVTPGPLLKRQVEAVEVGAIQGWRLVGDFVSFSVLVQVHGGLLDPGGVKARRRICSA